MDAFNDESSWLVAYIFSTVLATAANAIPTATWLLLSLLLLADNVEDRCFWSISCMHWDSVDDISDSSFTTKEC